jgi:hypothetical protein
VPLFALIAAAIAMRTLDGVVIDGQPQLPRWGLVDFRDAVYDPTRAFLDGQNPYDIAAYTARYPVLWGFPLYSPIAFLLYAPLALLDFPTAARLSLLLNLMLVPLVAFFALRLSRLPATAGAVFGVAVAALLSRGGYVTLAVGQSTVYVTLALYAALALARSRPWVASIALAVASLKPTFAVPVAVLMMARGDVGVVLRGGVLGAIGALLPLLWLAEVAGGVRPLIETLLGNNAAMRALDDVHATLAPLRVDVLAVLSRIAHGAASPLVEVTVTIAILAAAALIVRRLRRRPAGEPLVLLVIVCATLLCTYHQVYDVLLLTAPMVGLLLTDWVGDLGGTRTTRLALAALLGFPLANYAMSASFLTWVGWEAAVNGLGDAPAWLIALASVNNAALIAAFVLGVRLALRAERGA